MCIYMEGSWHHTDIPSEETRERVTDVFNKPPDAKNDGWLLVNR